MIPLIQFVIILLVEFIFSKKGVELKDRNKNPQQNNNDDEGQLQNGEQNENKELSEYQQKVKQYNEIKKQIQDDNYKAEQLNNPSTFAQHSKLLRKISKLEQAAQDLQQWINQNKPEEQQPLSKEEIHRKHQQAVKDKLDINDGKGLLRNLRIVSPLIVQLIFRWILPKAEIVMQEDYYYPLSKIYGNYDENTFTFQLGYILWTISCFRVVSTIKKVLSK